MPGPPAERCFSVVIPARNAARTLPETLRSLARQPEFPRLEVVVVEDGSVDGTAEAASCFPWCRVIRQPGSGAAAARNRGLRETRAPVVLFLDADCVAADDWIRRLVSPLEQDPGLGGTVGRFVSSQPNWVARLTQLELDARHRRMSRHLDTDFVNSATCAFRRSILGSDPFDVRFDKLEDIELSFRLAGQGVRMRYVPEATVEHRHPEALWVHVRRRFEYGRLTPALYRLHSGRLVRDSSTPQTRRLQLVLLAAALPAGLVWWPGGLVLALSSVLLAWPTLRAAWRLSPALALKAPAFIAAGNVGFLLGTVAGLLRRRP
jgi:glycosyltransferase involved in cell wall biosynthesis